MGSRDAKAYLASPAVVAASAIAGIITGPAEAGEDAPPYAFRELAQAGGARSVDVLPGFPAELRGRALLLPVDNLNTDGIYGKDVTYRDDLTPEQMATYAMANYDPEFQGKAAEGDIIVAGRNFGTGSSREQAATALKYRGVAMVVAASFSQTYLRNAFNNAFICLESPALYDAVRAAAAGGVAAGERTIVAGTVVIDVRRSVAIFGGAEYPIGPLGPAAQELIMAGGLEALTRSRIAAA
jgi:homoaconitate hydratase